MELRFSRHAEGRMVRDTITAAELLQVLTHPTHPPRPAGQGRLLARRVHAHSVLSVLYVQDPGDALVVSCWRERR